MVVVVVTTDYND